MPSVVIAAYNEEGVIRACLEALRVETSGLEVVVVPNGCSDRTADVARSVRGVQVVEEGRPGKTRALNIGDGVATRFPRAYLDADVVITADHLERLMAVVRGPVLAAAPRRELSARGCRLGVKSYAAVHRHLPVMASSLFGRGLVVVSEAGRGRFTAFPDVVADDLFLDGLFAADEKRVVDEVTVVVQLPVRTGDLLHRLVRVRRGNRMLLTSGDGRALRAPTKASRQWAWLGVVLRRPWLAPAGAVYCVLTILAEIGARRQGQGGWGRSSRPSG